MRPPILLGKCAPRWLGRGSVGAHPTHTLADTTRSHPHEEFPARDCCPAFRHCGGASRVLHTAVSTLFDCNPGSDEFISNVTVSNLSNNSVCGPTPGYENFTGTVAPVALVPGQAYVISISISQAWNTDLVYVMLDTNNNGTFETGVGGNELLATLGPVSGQFNQGVLTQVLSTTINIPGSATAATRLRVRLSYGTLPAGNEACASNSYGNCEDYATTPIGLPVPDEYQVNQPGCSHDIDGALGFGFVPAGVVTRCINDNFNVNMTSPWTGLPFDVFVGDVTLIPRSGGGYVSPSGNQVFNLNLLTMTPAFNGFTTPVPFPGSFTVTASLPVPISLATQMVILDPTNPDTVSVSQPSRLIIVPPASLAGFIPPTGDDATSALPTPVCIPFFGVNQNNAWVSTNGRVGFGLSPDAAFFPYVAGAMTGDPFVGYWCDLNVMGGASIVATHPASGLTRVQWNNVPYYNTAINNTFAVQFDANTKTVWIDMLPTIGFSSGGNAFLGLTKGAGATDPGQVAYQVGGIPSSGPGVAGPGMIYTLAIEGTGLTNLNGILFFWNAGSGNYDWTGL